MPVLLSDIASAVISDLSQVPGLSTQVYASPRIEQFVQDAYKLVIEEMWWADLCDYYTVTANGSSGQLTSDMVSTLNNHSVSRYQDIEAVYPVDLNKPLKQLPPRFNPSTLAGTNSVYISSNAQFPLRPFRVWPPTAADTLTVHARAYPKLPMSTTDTLYLDGLLLQYMADYMYAEDDGTNPGQIAKFKSMFEKRLVQMKAAEGQQPLALDTRFPTTEYEWSERE